MRRFVKVALDSRVLHTKLVDRALAQLSLQLHPTRTWIGKSSQMKDICSLFVGVMLLCSFFQAAQKFLSSN